MRLDLISKIVLFRIQTIYSLSHESQQQLLSKKYNKQKLELDQKLRKQIQARGQLNRELKIVKQELNEVKGKLKYTRSIKKLLDEIHFFNRQNNQLKKFLKVNMKNNSQLKETLQSYIKNSQPRQTQANIQYGTSLFEVEINYTSKSNPIQHTTINEHKQSSHFWLQLSQKQSVVARAYRASELVFDSINYSQQVDLWAFGCIAYELITGRTLFQSQSSVEHMLELLKMLGTPTLEQMCEMNPYFSLREYQSLLKIRKRSFKDAIGLKNIGLVDLLSKIFVYTPTKRLSATQALKYPYFNCLKQKQYYEQFDFYPEQLKIQFKQLSNEKEQVFRSSIKLYSNHKSLISTVSKLSENHQGPLSKSEINLLFLLSSCYC